MIFGRVYWLAGIGLVLLLVAGYGIAEKVRADYWKAEATRAERELQSFEREIELRGHMAEQEADRKEAAGHAALKGATDELQQNLARVTGERDMVRRVLEHQDRSAGRPVSAVPIAACTTQPGKPDGVPAPLTGDIALAYAESRQELARTEHALGELAHRAGITAAMFAACRDAWKAVCEAQGCE